MFKGKPGGKELHVQFAHVHFINDWESLKENFS